MIPEPKYLSYLLDAVALRFGVIPKTPVDFDLLAADIYDKTRSTIGISTLKRVWGYVKSDHGVTFSTLTKLCKYAGYADWDVFKQKMLTCGEPADTSGFGNAEFVSAASLKIGRQLHLAWGEDKGCILMKTEAPDTFRVLEAVNIKLKKDDRVEVNSFMPGRPLYVRRCIRDGISLGAYIAAQSTGLLVIEPLPL